MGFLPSSSPSNILLLTTFLIISHFPIYGHARVRAVRIIADKGFRSDCVFDLGDYSFNLCPLEGTVTTTAKYSEDHLIKNEEVGEPSSGTRFYEVVLGGMSTKGLRLPTTSDSVCDSDTWVYMTTGVSIESPVEHRLLSKNKSWQVLKAEATSVERKRRGNCHNKILVSVTIKDAESIGFSPLQLSIDGWEAEGRPQSAKIEIVCDFNVDSYLEFINEHDGIHSFRWTTRHGCPTNIETMYMQSSRLSTTADEAEDGESEKSEDDDGLLPQQGISTARRWMAVIIVFVVMTVLCSSLFLTSPRARHVAGETIQSLSHSLIPILSTAVIKLRPLGRSILALTPKSLLRGVGNPFRQGSNQLVRWAEEDMTLREADDMMVNGGGAYDDDEESWNGFEFNEYIPLTANLKHGRGKSYGTTPDVETFEQRGMLGGIGRLFSK